MGLAFLFPGQGSQFVGMGKDFYEKFEIVKKTFDEASEVLGFSISRLCFEGPEEELKKTYNTQPAILTMSVSLNRMLNNDGIYPDIVAGHSLGEYSALVSAGVLAFSDAVYLVRKRGEFMQEASPLGLGSMYAIVGLPREKVEEICRQASSLGVVEPANFNSEKQIVISGEVKALEKAGELAKEAGAKRVVPLSVSAPFHSSLMSEVGEKMRKEIEKVKLSDAKVPVIANYNAKALTKKEEILEALIKQIDNPVLWVDSMKLLAQKVNFALEVGPGKVLRGLMRDIDRNVKVMDIGKIELYEKAKEAILKDE